VAVEAGEPLRQEHLLPVHRRDADEPARDRQGELHRVGQALADTVLDAQPIDVDVQVVLAPPVERDVVPQIARLPVDADPDEPFAPEPGELLLERPPAPSHRRGEDGEPRALREGEDPIDHLLDRLRSDGLAAHRAVRAPGTREEIAAGRVLLDRDGRRQALDGLDLRLGEAVEELPRVGAQRLDVTALPLGVDGVEGEGRLAGAARAGDDHQPVARDGHVDARQVVLARAADDEVPRAHGGRSPARRRAMSSAAPMPSAEAPPRAAAS